MPMMLFVLATVLSATLAAEDDTATARARERVESITLAASGKAGTLVTSPEFMQGTLSTYAFGGRTCKQSLGPRTLEELFVAMRTGALVRIGSEAVTRGGESLACLRSVTFFAPTPH